MEVIALTSHKATEPIPVHDLLPVKLDLIDAPATNVFGERTNEAGVCGVRISSILPVCRARGTHPCRDLTSQTGRTGDAGPRRPSPVLPSTTRHRR